MKNIFEWIFPPFIIADHIPHEYNITMGLSEIMQEWETKVGSFNKGIMIFPDGIVIRGGDTVMKINNDGIKHIDP